MLIALLLLTVVRFVHIRDLRENYPLYAELSPGTDMVSNHQEALRHVAGTFPSVVYRRVFAYSYLVAAVYRFLPADYDDYQKLEAMFFFQAFLGVLAAFATGYAAWCFFGPAAGIIALFFSGFSSSALAFETELLEAAPARTAVAFCIAAAAYALGRLKDGEKQTAPCIVYICSGISGLFLGVAGLLRPNLMFVIPFAAVGAGMAYYRRRDMGNSYDAEKDPVIEEGLNNGEGTLIEKGLNNEKDPNIKTAVVVGLVFMLASASAYLPPLIRNAVVSGRLSGLISSAGSSLWIGNHPGSTGRLMIDRDRMEKLRKKGLEPGIREVIRFAYERPGRFLLLQFRKLFIFLSAEESANNIDPELVAVASAPVRYGPGFGVLIPPMFAFLIIGFIKPCPWQSGYSGFVFITSIFLGLMFSTVIFFVISRFRVIALPALEIMAAGALVVIPAIFRGSSRQGGIRYYSRLNRLMVVLAVLLGIITAHFFTLQARIRQHMTPAGRMIVQDEKIVIIDDSGQWAGGEILTAGPELMVVKQFELPDLSVFNGAYLEISMIVDNPPAQITVITGQDRVQASLAGASKPRKLAGASAVIAHYEISVEMLNSGTNSIAMIFPGRVMLPVDRTFNRGRSRVVVTEKGRKGTAISEISGELMIRMVLR